MKSRFERLVSRVKVVLFQSANWWRVGMRKNRRSIASQVRTLSALTTRFGKKKSVYRKAGKNQMWFTFSRNQKRCMTNFWVRMAKDIRKHHKEVREVKDLKVEHVQEYLDREAVKWGGKTYGDYVSYARHLEAAANHTWESCHLDFSGLSSKHPCFRPQEKAHTGQTTFTPEDLDLLKRNMSPHSWARLAPEIIEILGTRLDETVNILPEAVRIPDNPGENGDFGSVKLYETKGGRFREVPILNREDCEKMREMRDRAVRNGWTTLMAGLANSTVSHQIQAAKERAGLQEKYHNVGAHGIRRSYARKHYQSEYERLKDSKEFRGKNQAAIQRAAWAPTQKNLGHGKHHRQELWKIYAGGEDPK